MNVKKDQLIKQLRDNYGYTKKSAEMLVEDFISVVLDNIAKGDAVYLHNFGCFDIIERKGRTHPSIDTGEIVYSPSKWVPRFFAGKGMKLAVAKWVAEDKPSFEGEGE